MKKVGARGCMHIVAQSTDTGHCISSVNIRVATGSEEQVDRFAASNQPIVSSERMRATVRHSCSRLVLLAITAR